MKLSIFHLLLTGLRRGVPALNHSWKWGSMGDVVSGNAWPVPLSSVIPGSSDRPHGAFPAGLLPTGQLPA